MLCRFSDWPQPSARDRTRDRADRIVDGAPSLLYDPAVQFVCLSGWEQFVHAAS
jgi:hypothetical protein